MVVVMNVIMHARFERINAIGPFEMEVLGFQGAEEAFNRRVVEAVALAAHALLDSASHEHRSVGLHLVMPTLVGMHDQACALMARSNSPTLGHPKFPQAGPPDYDDSGATAMRAAASLRR